MNISKSGIELIKSFEGLRYEPYLCPANVWTVGYGHTGKDVVPGKRITYAEADKLLYSDLRYFVEAVNNLVKVQLSQNQFDALVSFIFNVGRGAFEASTLLKRLNDKEDPNTVAKEELPRWVKGKNDEVLEGLRKRRELEVELFCSKPGAVKTGTVDITSLQQTFLKKQPVASSELSNDQKAKVYEKRTIRNCQILEKKDGHTYLELGFGLGKWWVFDRHWGGLVEEVSVKAYAIKDDLKFLRNFPYFWQQDNGPEGWRQCQTSSLAMVLKYLNVPGINDDKDYLAHVNKHGDTTTRYAHYKALEELKVGAEFRTDLDVQDVKDQIDKGLPVPVGILHHGPVSAPSGGGHFIVIYGYSDTAWAVQDPYGKLDLVNGAWALTSETSGKNQLYSFENLNPRLFVGGGGPTGWGWINFKYPA